MDTTFCDATVDFNVPDKLNPPPIELLATVWTLSRSLPTGRVEKYVIEFTDPSGKLIPSAVPIATWIQVDPSTKDDTTPPKSSSKTSLHTGDADFFCE